MISKRYESIGLKQAIRFEWMQKVANLLLAGLDANTIRQELHEFLMNKKGDGSEGERSDQTRSFVVNNLMKVWVSPDPDLIPFRDASLAFLRQNPSMDLAVHWSMISAAYPFWISVARHTGRLIALQDQVTQAQIINRLKEQYGDRQTVSRYARFVIRSFVAWGVLKDSDAKGCYEKTMPVSVSDINLVVLMFESALLTTLDSKISLGLLTNSPGFFPFQIPVVSGDFLANNSERIDVARYGMGDELLMLR